MPRGTGRMRVGDKPVAGARWLLLHAGLAAVLALAGCGSDVACDSPEVKAALVDSMQGLFTTFGDFVVEEAGPRRAVCRATIIPLGMPLRYRVDLTTEGKVSVYLLMDGRR